MADTDGGEHRRGRGRPEPTCDICHNRPEPVRGAAGRLVLLGPAGILCTGCLAAVEGASGTGPTGPCHFCGENRDAVVHFFGVPQGTRALCAGCRDRFADLVLTAQEPGLLPPALRAGAERRRAEADGEIRPLETAVQDDQRVLAGRERMRLDLELLVHHLERILADLEPGLAERITAGLDPELVGRTRERLEELRRRLGRREGGVASSVRSLEISK